MFKIVKMILVDYNNEMKPFLINDDDIEIGDMVCELSITGEWLPMTIHTINDLDKSRQKKIIATPEQLGYVICDKWVTNEFGINSFNCGIREINSKDIDNIINNGGNCKIEMNIYEGDYCGYRTIKYNDNKVLIHTENE